MSPTLAALAAIVVYIVAYRFYSKFLANRVFRLDDKRLTPAHALNDGVDYVPTRPPVLFGHHFASITGLAPMLGPAVAVIWGWLPALVWVVMGAVLIGCVHDFGALVLSARARGLSVGKIAEAVVGARARTLFHLIIFFGVSLAMGVFVFVIGQLFSVQLLSGEPGHPGSVLPTGLLMVIALVSGYLIYKRKLPLVPVAAVGFALTLVGIWLGMKNPTLGLSESAWPAPSGWMWILLGYAFVASVLPVRTLLQSRDFLNSLLLYLGLILAFVGFFIANPEFDAPAIVSHPAGAPPMLPYVFIIIACGSVSGFHGLVSSGTTAKQLDRESHARPIGYGGMIGESVLGLLAVLACTAGFGSSELWHHHYANWHAAQPLATKINAFIDGTTSFLTELGISAELASALIAMVVVSFALTSLDSATRLLRFNVEEISQSLAGALNREKAKRIQPLNGLRLIARFVGGNRYVSTALACAAIGFFGFYEVNGRPAAIALWQLFGTTNQLLAGLTLGLVTLYLKHRKWPIWFTGIPAVFMMGSTLVAMVGNLRAFATGEQKNWLLLIVGGVLFILALWLLVEAVLVVMRPRKVITDPEVTFVDADDRQ